MNVIEATTKINLMHKPLSYLSKCHAVMFFIFTRLHKKNVSMVERILEISGLMNNGKCFFTNGTLLKFPFIIFV